MTEHTKAQQTNNQQEKQMSGDHNMHCSANQPDKKTPLALRLADAIYEAAEDYVLFDKDMGYEAAAELRRLHSLNAELVDALEEVPYMSNKDNYARVTKLIAKAREQT